MTARLRATGTFVLDAPALKLSENGYPSRNRGEMRTGDHFRSHAKKRQHTWSQIHFHNYSRSATHRGNTSGFITVLGVTNDAAGVHLFQVAVLA